MINLFYFFNSIAKSIPGVLYLTQTILIFLKMDFKSSLICLIKIILTAIG